MTRQQRANEQENTGEQRPIQGPPTRVQAATVCVIEYLAKLAGRSSDASILASERNPFGPDIALVETRHHDEALFSRIGLRNRKLAGQDTYSSFIELPNYRQDIVIGQLIELAACRYIELSGQQIKAKNPLTFWRSTDQLFKDLACTGQMSRPSLGQPAVAFWQLPVPKETKPAQDSRDALIWTLIALITKMYRLPAVHNKATLDRNFKNEAPNTDAVELVSHVLSAEFPEKLITRSACSNVWDRTKTLTNKNAENDWKKWDAVKF